MPNKYLKFSTLSHFFIALVLDGLLRLSGLFMLEILQSGIGGRQKAAMPFAFSWAVANIVASFSDFFFRSKKSDNAVLLGVLLTATGAALCLLTTNITAQILCWGLIFGAGYGLSSPHLSKHLRNTNCTKLSSFLQATPSLGAAIMPFIFHILTSRYGLQGSYLLFSGIILNYLPLFVAAAYNIKVVIPNIKWRVRKRSSRYFVSKQEKSQEVSNESFINSFEPDMILKISQSEECQDDLVIDRDSSNVKEVICISRKRSCTRCNDLQGLPLDGRIMPRHRTKSDMFEEIKIYEKEKKVFEESFCRNNIVHEDAKSIHLENMADRNCNDDKMLKNNDDKMLENNDDKILENNDDKILENNDDKILENNVSNVESHKITEVIEELNAENEISQIYPVCPNTEIAEKMESVSGYSEKIISDSNVIFHGGKMQETRQVFPSITQKQVQTPTSTVREQVQIRPRSVQVETSAIHDIMQIQTSRSQEQLQDQTCLLQEQNEDPTSTIVQNEVQIMRMQKQVKVKHDAAQEQIHVETSTVQDQMQIQKGSAQEKIPVKTSILQEQKEVITVQEQKKCQSREMQEQVGVETTIVQEQIQIQNSKDQEQIQIQRNEDQEQIQTQFYPVQEQNECQTSPIHEQTHEKEYQSNTVPKQMQSRTRTVQVQMQARTIIGKKQVRVMSSTELKQMKAGTNTIQKQVQAGTNTVHEQVQVGAITALEQVKAGSSTVQEQMKAGTSTMKEQVQYGTRTAQEQVIAITGIVQQVQAGTSTVQVQVQDETSTVQVQVQDGTSTKQEQVRAGTSTVQEQVQSGTSTVHEQVQAGTSAVQAGTSTVQEQVQAGTSTVQKQLQPGTSTVQEQAETNTVQEQVQAGTSTVHEQVQAGISTVQDQVQAATRRVQEQVQAGSSTAQKQVKIQANTEKEQVQIKTDACSTDTTLQDEVFQNFDKSRDDHTVTDVDNKDFSNKNYKNISLLTEKTDEKANILDKIDQKLSPKLLTKKTVINVPLTIKVHVEEFTFMDEDEYLSETLNDKYIKPRKNSYRKHSNSMMPGAYDNIDFTTLNSSKKFENCSEIEKPKLSCIYSISEHTEIDDHSSFSLKLWGKDKNGGRFAISKIKPIFKFADDITKPVCLCIILIKIIFDFNLVTLITIFADFGKDVDSDCCDFKWILVAFGVGGLLGKFCCCKISRTIPEKSHAIGVVLFLLTGLSTAGVLYSPNLNWLAGFYCILGALEGGITFTIPKFVIEHIDRGVHRKLSSAKNLLSGIALMSVPYVIGLSRDELGDYEFLLQTLSCSSVLCAFLAYFLPHLSRPSDQRINYTI